MYSRKNAKSCIVNMMNNSSISALYRNVLAVLHIHLYNFVKASVPVAPGCVRQLNKSKTTATCPCKPEDQINNICSWQPSSHHHYSHSVSSVVHKSCQTYCLSNGCWSLHKQASATAGHKISDPLCMQNFFKHAFVLPISFCQGIYFLPWV